MKNIRKKLLFSGAYVLTFVAALIFTCMIENYGVNSGSFDTPALRLPSLYIIYSENNINEMQAYTTDIDCGYLRDSVTPLNDGGIDIGLRSNGHSITEMKYKLTNAANEYVVEEGNVASGGTQLSRLTFVNPLVADREYCLTLTLTNAEGQAFYFYTRVISGESYETAEKLQFVWTFNKNTMDPEKASAINPYLEPSAVNDDMSFTNIDIHSNVNSVMWGNLSPSVTGAMATNIKAITSDAATIQLLYKVQVYEDAQTYTEYYVNEYYTIQKYADGYHLKDFKRSLNEIPKSNSFAASGNMLKLGIVAETSLNLITGVTANGDAAAFVVDGRLWYYDVTDNLVSCVFTMNQSQNSQEFYGNYPYGIRTLSIEEDGTVYFIVYGYMTGGIHEGENGIAVYTYDSVKNSLEEKAFIPSGRGWEVLKMNINKLAYMNEDHQLYLCLDDIVYRIDYTSGQVRPVVEQLDINNYKLSADGTMLAMPDNVNAAENTGITVYYLDTDEKKTISGNGQAVRLLGFFENDIVYGTADASLIYEDSDGSEVVPMDRIYIADRDLNVIREYGADGKYILDVKFNDSSVDITLAVRSGNAYTLTDGDYLVNNKSQEEDKISLTTVYDDVRRNELYLKLPVNSLSKPLSQTARVQDFQESVFEIDEQPASDKFYLYTGDGLYRDYTSLTDAIDACTKPTGIVVSETKQIVWQKSVRADTARLEIREITKGGYIESITRAICGFAETADNVNVDSSMSLRQALAANLTEHSVVSLKGLDLDDALYFVSSGRPVVAKLRENEFVLIVGYNSEYLQIGDPSTGEISDWNYRTYKAVFEEQGNMFLSYY